MHRVREFRGKRRIDRAMTFDPGLPAERFRYDIDPEVGLPARSMAGMPCMQMGFVNDPEAFRRESRGQLFCDRIGNPHSLGL
jgi:hypothetical protein